MKKFLFLWVGLCFFGKLTAQEQTYLPTSSPVSDTAQLSDTPKKQRPKIDHAEPLYIDLIRDLGARKGEKEWNFGFEMKDNLGFDQINALVEYEFAPIDRLGLEVELPFSFYTPQQQYSRDSLPSAGLNSFKTAIQWSFLVSETTGISMALGYIHETLLPSFKEMKGLRIRGHAYNPFLVIARKWSNKWHSLLYTGPILEKLNDQPAHFEYAINSSVHFMIPESRNFVGIELNKDISKTDFSLVIRPQMRLAVTNKILLGIVAAVPVSKGQERMSLFTRLIWEPGHK